MLTKFESKSARVKGLAFHPQRPWICATLHNGTIQLWDYRVGTLLDKFEEHEGPVRGVDFHTTLPLLASGGDDYKVKVWDYKLKRCLFTLLGHLDYIRTVQFHPQPVSFPWMLSASDDQTLRLWNYETRSCLSVLTGHNHYVMCASFHPAEDLIVSASLDQTVRVWDTTGLRKKHTMMGSSDPFGQQQPRRPANSAAMSVQAELFGTNDVIVKYVLEGHDRGVNWASFHPTLPLIVSAADDRQVKLWRMSDTKAWEVDTLRGHGNNVSCCLFHPNPKLELVISNSEDRSIRVWDVSKRVGVQTFRRDSDRFWILAGHPTQNLLAAGHDSGMIVFKLERERPAYVHTPKKCYFVRGRELVCHDYPASSSGSTISAGHDVPLTTLRRTGTTTEGIGGAPRYLSYNTYNPKEGNLLVCSDVDGGSYELVTFGLHSASSTVTDGKRGACMGVAVFCGQHRFAVLDRHSRQIILKNLNNETTKRVAPPMTAAVEGIYEGGTSGRLLVHTADDLVHLMELQSRRTLAQVAAPKLKSVVWSADGSRVALVCKYGIVLADKQLQQLCSMTDTVRIKSGAWDASPNPTKGVETCNTIFVYTTLHHAKYVLPSGESGTLCALEQPVYACRALADALYALDREGRMRCLDIDTTEARFKLAVEGQQYVQVMELVQHSRLCGKAIVGYLQTKGFPEMALHFVRDPKTRFQLALACGDIETALEAAFSLEQSSDPAETKKVWTELGQCALSQGNHQVVEMSYQRTKDLDRLSFLYLISGDTPKLQKMLKIANLRGDAMGRYHNALLLGNVMERIQVLEQAGHWSLAYMCAKVHALPDEMERLKVLMETNEATTPVETLDAKLDQMTAPRSKGILLQPPTPIIRATNWPTLDVPKKMDLAQLSAKEAAKAPAVEAVSAPMDAFEDPMVDDIDAVMDEDNADDDDAGWGDDDLDDFGEDFVAVAPAAGAAGAGAKHEPDVALDAAGFQMPVPGRPAAACWTTNSSHAADHLAAGAASSAMQLLHRQVAACNFSALKEDMIGCYLASHASLPGLSIPLPLTRNHTMAENATLPRTFITAQSLQQAVRLGYAYFQKGKFTDAKTTFVGVLHKIPLCVTTDEAQLLKELLEVAREYVTALRIKTAMAETEDAKRLTELSAYFTHCQLQPAHLLLALRSAMGTAFKHKNYIVAASFARRLLELPDMQSAKNAELRQKVSKVLQKSNAMARNEHVLDYNDAANFVLDCETFLPIYDGAAVKCPYCGSNYAAANGVCVTCTLSKVGETTMGLVTGA